MSLLKGKLARISAAGLSATALAVALVAPGAVMGQSITLHRCNFAVDPTCQSNVQVAVPIAVQLARQGASIDPSATSTQSNSSTQSADNENKGAIVNLLSQAQKNVQVGGDQSNDLTSTQRVESEASVSTKGGDTTAIGPNAIVKFNLSQDSDASIHGSAIAASDTGDAGNTAVAKGDIDASGGDASGSSTATGGNGNGNARAIDVAKQIKSGNSLASSDVDAGDGGDARSHSGDATGSGGGGGGGGGAGSATNGGNGNDATAASIAASIAAVLARSGSATSDEASNTANSGPATGGNGGAGGNGGNGDGTSGAPSATGGVGGTANSNSNSSTPTTNNTSGNADASTSGNNGSAWSDGRGGTANGGGSNGNGATATGNSNSGGNATDAAIVGGNSQNFLSVGFNQQGNASAQGGNVSNTGSATSSPQTTATQTGTNQQPQTQTTTLTGTTGTNHLAQDANSLQRAVNTNDAVTRALGRASQTANGGGNSATAPSQDNTQTNNP